MTLQQISKEQALNVIAKKYPEEIEWITQDSLDYWAWPQVLGSTAGPFGGVGGQAFTTFTIEAWESNRVAVLFCGNKILRVVKDWNGPQSDRL